MITISVVCITKSVCNKQATSTSVHIYGVDERSRDFRFHHSLIVSPFMIGCFPFITSHQDCMLTAPKPGHNHETTDFKLNLAG